MVVNFIKQLFGTKKTVLQEADPVAIEVKNDTFPGEFDPYTVMDRSPRISGWCNEETGELYKGFAVSESDVVLDVGCGGGGNAVFCAHQGAHIVFADIDPAMVEETGRLLQGTPARKIEAIVTDANPLPLPDETFTRIVSTEVIEHVADPMVFLKELVRVGKPGALYLLAVPDPASEAIFKQIAHPSCFEPPNHIRILGRDEFTQLVSDAGLEILSHEFYGFYSTVWWSLFWSSPKDGMRPVGHATLDHWAAAWDALLKCEHGKLISDVLDKALPKSQLVIARKR